MGEAVLSTRGLTKHFGGLAAVQNVSLEVKIGELHAIIGPNGAGKTTLINLLSGELAPSGGAIYYRGADLSRLSAEKRARLGIGRSYQKTNIFPTFSALENCRLAAQSRAPRPFHWLRNALAYDDTLQIARSALAAANLTERASHLALALSHGEQRQLEIAICLATGPQLLLLDEPLAGMGTEESIEMVDLIGKLALNHAVLLVEHDMDAVFQLARTLTVMVEGKVLASGAPEEIRVNPQVQAAYLGRSHEAQ